MVSIIPSGSTSVLQPLDVWINKPFKYYMRQRFDNWFKTEGILERNRTKKGYISAPPLALLTQWIL